MTVNGYTIAREPSSISVIDSRGGTRYSIERTPGALARAARFARMQRKG